VRELLKKSRGKMKSDIARPDPLMFLEKIGCVPYFP